MIEIHVISTKPNGVHYIDNNNNNDIFALSKLLQISAEFLIGATQPCHTFFVSSKNNLSVISTKIENKIGI